jgi:outer membrane protein assembly factor BamB
MTDTPRKPRFHWAALALATIGLSLVAVPVFDWADADPLYRGGVLVGSMVLLLAGVLGLTAWFVFSGLVTRPLRTLAVLAIGLIGIGAALIAGGDVTGDLGFVPRFRWQPDPEARLEAYRAQASEKPLPPVDLTIDPIVDFPRYRGFHADGTVQSDRLLANDWSDKPPEIVWRHPCGGGFSGFAVAGNGLVTVEQRKNEEVIVCYDRATGLERWKYSYPAFFRDPTGNGPRATPTIASDAVFSLGAEGDLVCLEATTGKKRWQCNILEDCQAKRVIWGMTGSPLVWDDLVIVNPGIDPQANAQKAVAAYDVKTGQRRWARGKHGAGYSSPMRATIAGQDMILLFDAGGLAGIDPEDGNELWRHEWKTFQDMNIIQPLVIDKNKILISSEAANGVALLQVGRQGNDWATQTLWQNRFLVAKYANPVLLGQSIYGLSNGTLVCLDAVTGERNWRGRYYGHGQLLAVDGHLLILGERGQVALVSGDRRSFRELASFSVLEGRTWNTPALAEGMLYIRNDKEMACLRLPSRD